MKILVTGHKGFIGSHVFNHLKTIGHQVSGIDFPDDIVDFEGGDYDVIIHLAAFAALRDSFENPDRFWENNVVKSIPIFEFCKKIQFCKKIGRRLANLPRASATAGESQRGKPKDGSNRSPKN